MRVLCVIDSLGSGGAQKQLVEIGKGLKEDGYEVEFLIYYKHFFFKKVLDDAGIKVNVIAQLNIFGRLLGIIGFFKKNRPDVIISFLEIPSFFCELASFFYKPNKLIIGERSADPKILKSWKRRAMRFLHLRADYIVANSYCNIDIVKKCNPFLKDDKLKVVYNIIDLNLSERTEKTTHKFSDKIEVIVVASHQYWKNAKGMIEAITLLSKESKDRLNISWFGDKNRDGSYEEAQNLVVDKGLSEIITFYDHTNNIYQKIASADVLALFSFYEGFPNVIGEAMSLGKTVISSDISDISKIVDRKFVFNPNDVKDISNILFFICSLNNSELEVIGDQNKQIAKVFFNKKNNLELYKDLIHA